MYEHVSNHTVATEGRGPAVKREKGHESAVGANSHEKSTRQRANPRFSNKPARKVQENQRFDNMRQVAVELGKRQPQKSEGEECNTNILRVSSCFFCLLPLRNSFELLATK